MILLKRIITVALSIIGSLAGIIILALINWLAKTGLSGGEVVLFGLISGVILGVSGGYLLINYFINKTRNYLLNKFGGTIGRFDNLRRI